MKGLVVLAVITLLSGLAAASTTTHQGGGDANRPCITTTLPAGVESLVAADNAGSPSGAVWDYSGSGMVSLTNPAGAPAQAVMRVYWGDQSWAYAVAGGALSYYWNTPFKLSVPAKSSIIVPFAFLSPGNVGTDYYAFYVTITPSQPLSCGTISYFTEEND